MAGLIAAFFYTTILRGKRAYQYAVSSRMRAPFGSATLLHLGCTMPRPRSAATCGPALLPLPQLSLYAPHTVVKFADTPPTRRPRLNHLPSKPLQDAPPNRASPQPQPCEGRR